MAGGIRVRRQLDAAAAKGWITERVTQRSEEIVTSMVEAFQAEIPFYATLGVRLLDDVRQMVAVAFRTIVEHIGEGRPFGPGELDLLHVTAHRRAAQGFPLHAILRTYHVGVRVAWEAFLEELFSLELDREVRSQVVSEVSSTLFELISQMTKAFSDTYLHAQREAAAVEERTRRDLLEELLSGTTLDEERLRARAEAAGLPLGPAHLVGVVAVRDLPAPPAEPLTRQLAAAVPCATLVREGSLVAIVPVRGDGAAERAALEALAGAVDLPAGARCLVGLGEVEAGLPGIRASYLQALQALEVLEAARGLPPTLRYLDAAPYLWALRSREAAHDLVQSLLVPLARERDGQLLDTLEAFLAARGNHVEAARRAHVHRQTLYSRLEKIRAATGRDPACRRDAVLFEMALAAARILPAQVLERA